MQMIAYNNNNNNNNNFNSLNADNNISMEQNLNYRHFGRAQNSQMSLSVSPPGPQNWISSSAGYYHPNVYPYHHHHHHPHTSHHQVLSSIMQENVTQNSTDATVVNNWAHTHNHLGIGTNQHYHQNLDWIPQLSATTTTSNNTVPGSTSSSHCQIMHHGSSEYSANEDSDSPISNRTISPGFRNNKSPYEWMKKSSIQTEPSSGECKTRTKDKYRVVYTDQQRLELEKEFHFAKYITIRRKTELAAFLGLSERQVKIWFQNRRAKERKQVKKRQELGQCKQEPIMHDTGRLGAIIDHTQLTILN